MAKQPVAKEPAAPAPTSPPPPSLGALGGGTLAILLLCQVTHDGVPLPEGAAVSLPVTVAEQLLQSGAASADLKGQKPVAFDRAKAAFEAASAGDTDEDDEISVLLLCQVEHNGEAQPEGATISLPTRAANALIATGAAKRAV